MKMLSTLWRAILSTSTGSPVFVLSGLILSSLAISSAILTLAQLRVRLEVEIDFTVFVGQARNDGASRAFVKLFVEGLRDGFKGNNFIVANFDFAYHVWLRFPLIARR